MRSIDNRGLLGSPTRKDPHVRAARLRYRMRKENKCAETEGITKQSATEGITKHVATGNITKHVVQHVATEDITKHVATEDITKLAATDNLARRVVKNPVRGKYGQRSSRCRMQEKIRKVTV